MCVRLRDSKWQGQTLQSGLLRREWPRAGLGWVLVLGYTANTMIDLEPVPAATVAVVRDNPQQQALEVLLLQRNTDLAFMGGHWVFPGGRVEQHDYPDSKPAAHQAAACQAAVRETQEETGLVLDPGALVHIAHWTTPPNLARRFSTWFFVCPLRSLAEIDSESHSYSHLHSHPHPDANVATAPAYGSGDVARRASKTSAQTPVIIDNAEILDFLWLTPARALDAAQQGDLVLAQPTRATLANFIGHHSLDSLMVSVTGSNIHVYPDNSPYYQPAGE